jgi:hypothetical protein
MASIAPIVIGCIDYLAYGTIFTCVTFHPKIKLDVFFPARKAIDERWEVVCNRMRSHAIASTTVRFLENTLGMRSGTESLPEVFLRQL